MEVVLPLQVRVDLGAITMNGFSTFLSSPELDLQRGVMVKVMDCGIVVSEFKLQSRYYVHFQTNTLGKDMNPLIFPTMG